MNDYIHLGALAAISGVKEPRLLQYPALEVMSLDDINGQLIVPFNTAVDLLCQVKAKTVAASIVKDYLAALLSDFDRFSDDLELLADALEDLSKVVRAFKQESDNAQDR
jgi:hypothetical protein